MRFLIELQAVKDCAYDMKYHHKLQGFIYNLLKGTVYSNIHDKRGYKFFSFSNIFPPKDVKAGVIRQLLISSPDRNFMKILKDKLDIFKKEGKTVNIGEMLFEVKNIFILEPKLGRSCELITGTPIVIRIPKKNYEKYEIKPPKDYDYIYWRKNYPFKAFIKQLEDSLFKKYEDFYNISVKQIQIFEQFIFKKQVCNHIIIQGKEIKVFGSLWEFVFSNLDNEKRNLLQFCTECGFGELNSLGFGFMNIVR